jgi:hypothetical protein
LGGSGKEQSPLPKITPSTDFLHFALSQLMRTCVAIGAIADISHIVENSSYDTGCACLAIGVGHGRNDQQLRRHDGEAH